MQRSYINHILNGNIISQKYTQNIYLYEKTSKI